MSTERSGPGPGSSLASHTSADIAGQGRQPSLRRSQPGTYRRTLPLHPPRLAGVWPQLLESEGRGAGRELGVPKEGAALDALLFEGLIVLVEVLDGVVVSADSLGSQAVPLQTGGHSTKGHHGRAPAVLPSAPLPATKLAWPGCGRAWCLCTPPQRNVSHLDLQRNPSSPPAPHTPHPQIPSQNVRGWKGPLWVI